MHSPPAAVITEGSLADNARRTIAGQLAPDPHALRQASKQQGYSRPSNGYHHSPSSSSSSSASESLPCELTQVEGGSLTSPCDHLITHCQYGKAARIIQEATKNDATFVPLKLWDYVVKMTNSTSCSPIGCTVQETTDWLVRQLQERLNTGQFWVTLKVFSLLHELLLHGSIAFAESMATSGGFAVLNFEALIHRIQATTQENPTGGALPCTIRPACSDSSWMPFFHCKQSWSSLLPSKIPSIPEHKLLQLDNFLKYLQGLVQYRLNHRCVNLSQNELYPNQPDNLEDLKCLLTDTLQLITRTADFGTTVLPTTVLGMVIVRQRMNDVRVLYKVTRYVLARMLEVLFADMQASFEAEGIFCIFTAPKASLSPSASDLLGSTPPSSCSISGSRTLASPITDRHRRQLLRIISEWYDALCEVDKIEKKMQRMSSSMEKLSGETFGASYHVRRIPKRRFTELSRYKWLLRDGVEEPPPVPQANGYAESPPQEDLRCSSDIIREHSVLAEQSQTPPTTGESTVDSGSNMGVMSGAARGSQNGPVPVSLDQVYALWHCMHQCLQELFDTGDKTPVANAVLAQPSLARAAANDKVAVPCDSVMGSKTQIISEELLTHWSSSLSPLHESGGIRLSPSASLTGTFIVRRKGLAGGFPGTPLTAAVPTAVSDGIALLGAECGSNMECFPLTEEMQRTDASIQALLQEDDVVVVCNEPFSLNDSIKLIDRFQVLDRSTFLGEGSFGKVYRAWDELVGCYLAAKEIPLHESKPLTTAVRESLKEYTVLTALHHPNIVRVVAFMVVGRTGRIFMEWMPSGSLQDVLRHIPSGRLRENVVSRYARDMLVGLAYLHERGVLHRDIKPGNVLLDTNGTVKLTDFGTSLVLQNDSQTLESTAVTGTVSYMAPEAVQGTYSSASDVWSLGCTLLELATGRTPWADPLTGARKDPVPLLFMIGGLNDTDRLDRPHTPYLSIPQHTMTPTPQDDDVMEDSTPILPPDRPIVLSDALVSFLNDIFTVDRRRRPSAGQLLRHPFIAAHHRVWALRQAQVAEAMADKNHCSFSSQPLGTFAS